MLISLVSAKHAPGVTTVATLLTWAWPEAVGRRALLVEADPAGGDVLVDLYEGAAGEQEGYGLLAAAVAARYGMTAGQLGRYALRLDGQGRRLLLPGLADPAQGAALRDTWGQIAGALADLDRLDDPVDVVADCGRLGAFGPPTPLLTGPDVLLVVLRPTLRDVAAAAPRVSALLDTLAPVPQGPLLAVLLVGDGPYSADDVAEHLDVAVVGPVPWESRLDRVGLRIVTSRGYARSALGRAVAGLAATLADRVAARADRTAPSLPAAPPRAALPPSPPPSDPVQAPPPPGPSVPVPAGSEGVHPPLAADGGWVPVTRLPPMPSPPGPATFVVSPSARRGVR
ncbi:hypothetical protein [Parafrankia discariae]|uniref:hypothetical protein n=1 Tax=Parafrankia discariae TaxID=365528 RepID=UPI00039F0912|nr:hypothetical protein [Parafrankia discariae]